MQSTCMCAEDSALGCFRAEEQLSANEFPFFDVTQVEMFQESRNAGLRRPAVVSRGQHSEEVVAWVR